MKQPTIIPTVLKWLITSFLLCSATFASGHDDSSATYLGNEGVLVTSGESKILFDAFYANAYDKYLLVPDQLVEALHKGTPPYDDVDAIFVSHAHGDHFSVEPAVEYLRAQPHVVLYGPTQAIDAIRAAGVAEDDPLMERLVAVDLKPEDPPKTITAGNLHIDVVAVPHAGNRPTIQNYVWRVELDNQTTVMHLGDADTDPSHFTRHEKHFSERHSHAAFPPYWFLDDDNGQTVLRNLIKADQVIGVHVPAESRGLGDELRERLGGDVFTDPGETRDLLSIPEVAIPEVAIPEVAIPEVPVRASK